jgi:hypothetical protein
MLWFPRSQALGGLGFGFTGYVRAALYTINLTFANTMHICAYSH